MVRNQRRAPLKHKPRGDLFGKHNKREKIGSFEELQLSTNDCNDTFAFLLVTGHQILFR